MSLEQLRALRTRFSITIVIVIIFPFFSFLRAIHFHVSSADSVLFGRLIFSRSSFEESEHSVVEEVKFSWCEWTQFLGRNILQKSVMSESFF